MLFKIIGAIGIIIISYGITRRTPLSRNQLFICGGTLLLAYSIHLKDPIFIPLQIIFILASLYEIYKK